MINMLSGLYVEGFVNNEPQISKTENNVPKTIIYLTCRIDVKQKESDDNYSVSKKYVTLPFRVFGSTASFFFENIVKGQRILVEYKIESYREENKGFPIPSLVCTSIRPLETTEVAKDRLLKQRLEREERQKEENESVVENEEKEGKKQSYDISDEELPFD
ncbi:single-stranded DNA-binding protein [Macrococcus sp. PK]|uniref:single-stranded DNA-binding protein n=1 Tax=Macrococcus sp. PK TaxID=2801919 RepID=UPI001F0DB8E4|nr:single-stranded DNA-binding protein [Macrococcus sp. PK]MCH4984276.1 single-stranded DNA-binding protein [Macrococcus sp. PK]